MELHSLNYSLSLSKRSLRIWFWQWMNNYLSRWLHILSHRGKIITLRVPNNSLYDVLESYLDHFSSVYICSKRPFPELLLLIIEKDILVIVLFSLINQFRSRGVDFSGIKTRVYYINDLFISCSYNAFFLVRIPFNAIYNFVVKFVFS